MDYKEKFQSLTSCCIRLLNNSDKKNQSYHIKKKILVKENKHKNNCIKKGDVRLNK